MEHFKKWCALKSNLKVMHLHKKIPCGPARNLAVSKAAGDYVMCIDIDDRLASKEALSKVLDGLDGKDIYTCSYISRRDKHEFILKPQDMEQLAKMPVACWAKICKRELWVN